MSEEERVAKGLTEAQRQCVLSMSAVALQPVADEPAARHLYNRELASFTGGGEGPRKYRLTPLGLAVRTILQSQGDTHG